MFLKAKFEIVVYAYPDDKYLIVATGEARPLRLWCRSEEFKNSLPVRVRLRSTRVSGQIAAREVAFTLADELGISKEEIQWLVS